MDGRSGTPRQLTRRYVVGLGFAVGFAGLAAACAAPSTPAPAPTTAPAPTAAPKAAAPTVAPKPAEPTAAPKPAATTAPAAPKALEKVTLRLDFLIGGHHTAFFVGKDKGYYKESGIDLEILESQGSTQAIQLVGTKNAPFGFADGAAMARAVAQGIPVKMVVANTRRSGTGLPSLKEVGIKVPKDLEGKIYGAIPGTNGHALWPAFVKINNVDDSKIQVVNVDAASSNQLILTGKIHFTDGLMGGDDDRIERAGKPASFMAYADWGVNAGGYGVLVHNDFIKENPDQIRRFVAATVKSWDYTRANPNESVETLIKTSNMQDARRLNAPSLLKAALSLVDSDNSKGKPTGFQSDKDWENIIKILTDAGILNKAITINDVFTNDFLPKT